MKSICIWALALAGCAASQEKIESARTAWGDCVKREVARVDDGKTDPFSIAYGVAPMCGKLYQELTADVVSQNVTEDGQGNMRRQMSANELRLITSAVLAHRAKHS
jgi:hypothetical protein